MLSFKPLLVIFLSITYKRSCGTFYEQIAELVLHLLALSFLHLALAAEYG